MDSKQLLNVRAAKRRPSGSRLSQFKRGAVEPVGRQLHLGDAELCLSPSSSATA